jgi:endonuclease/exonuclease/phosphatase family metal-dependent hydrolase
VRSLIACALALSACSVGVFEAPEASSASDIFAEAPRPRRSPVTLRVASYNVLYALAAEDGTVDADTLERATSLDADVLLLQETNATWEAALRPALARRYERCVFHEPQKWAPEGLALCAKGKIVEDELIPSELGGFPAQRAVAEVSGVTLQILNLHLRPAVANPAEWVDSHVKTRHERAREIRDYLPRLRADLPTILGGDMNEQPEGDLFGELARAGYDSALPEGRCRRLNVDVGWRRAAAVVPARPPGLQREPAPPRARGGPRRGSQ